AGGRGRPPNHRSTPIPSAPPRRLHAFRTGFDFSDANQPRTKGLRPAVNQISATDPTEVGRRSVFIGGAERRGSAVSGLLLRFELRRVALGCAVGALEADRCRLLGGGVPHDPCEPWLP